MKHYFKTMADMYKTSKQTRAGSLPLLAPKETWITFSFSSYGLSYENKEVRVTSVVRINREKAPQSMAAVQGFICLDRD